jgi:hypothetical protein
MSDTPRSAPSRRAAGATTWTGSVALFNGRYHVTYDVRPRGTTAEAAARRAIRLAQDQLRAARPGRRRPQLTEIRLTLTRVPTAGGGPFSDPGPARAADE